MPCPFYRLQTPLETPRVSILVRVKNEISALPEFWRRLEMQSCFQDCEVIFLDSGSTDGTVEFLAAHPCSVYQIAPEDFGFGSSCNTMMRLSRARIAVLISGHVLLQSSTDLETMMQSVAPYERAAAYVRQIPNDHAGSNAYERAFLSRRFPARLGGCLELLDPGSFSNAASVFTREAWLDNPFPEVTASEDYLWAKRHLELGGKLFYLPNVEVLHSHNEPANTVFRRVRINVEARGLTRSYARAAAYCGGVFASTLHHGASVPEAWRYAINHAKAYL